MLVDSRTALFWLVGLIVLVGCESSSTSEATPKSSASKKNATSEASDARSKANYIDATEEMIDQVKNDIREFQNATFNADVDTIIRFTPAETMERMGGEEVARESLEFATGQMKEDGVVLEKLEFPDDIKFLDGNENHFSIVPYESVIEVNGKRVETKSFFIGVRPLKEDDWRYADGNKSVQMGINESFPDFPADGVLFPAHSQELR